MRRLYNLQTRFALLEEFLKQDFPLSCKELAYAWLDAGFTPGEGAAKAAEKLRELPGNFSCPDGFQEKIQEKESRFYRIYDRIYIYNRRYSMNLPMVWANVTLP